MNTTFSAFLSVKNNRCLGKFVIKDWGSNAGKRRHVYHCVQVTINIEIPLLTRERSW